MQRQCYFDLLEWKRSGTRKPLILQGARQVGKTYLLEHFARAEYEKVVYCNFEEDPSLQELFEHQLTASVIIERLGFYMNQKITPGDTLVIFDEVQLAPRAITSLKYINEQANEYHVVAAGSLLGVSIGQSASFPVGKVNFLQLYPLNFLEFLTAVGELRLVELLQGKQDFETIPKPIHEKLLRLFDIFLFVGGMPEVVANYVDQRDIAQVQQLQSNIHKSYQSDFSKYAEPHESQKISSLWQTIPSQLAKENKKFVLNALQKGARYSQFELAIEWLRKAGLIYLSYNIKAGRAPLSHYVVPNIFKLYYLDTGLLGSRLSVSSKILALHEPLYTEFKGALIENYVAKELKPLFDESLYYWSSKSRAEVDFVIEYGGQVVPLEVKSGTTKHKKSLVSFQQQYDAKLIIRASPRNFTRDGDFVNVPLYAISIMNNILPVVLSE